MKKYIKIYCDYFGYCEDEFIPSELSGEQSADVHHIIYKSAGGKDEIENLIALTRKEHDKAHFINGKLSADYLQNAHNKFIKRYDKNSN